MNGSGISGAIFYLMIYKTEIACLSIDRFILILMH